MTNLTENPNSSDDGSDNSSNHESEQTLISGEVKAAVQTLTESDPSFGVLLKSADGEKVLNTITTIAVSIVREHDSGPYPSARKLKAYNEALPEGANRLFTMTENEQKHRHAMEKEVLALKQQSILLSHEIALSEAKLKNKSLSILSWQTLRRQTFALALSFAVLGFGYLLLDKGHPGWAVSVIAANFIGIALAFLQDRKKDKSKNDSSSLEPEEESKEP